MEIAQILGDRPVETSDPVLSERRYSARIAHRITLDPMERVKRLSHRFVFLLIWRSARERGPLDFYPGRNRIPDERSSEWIIRDQVQI